MKIYGQIKELKSGTGIFINSFINLLQFITDILTLSTPLTVLLPLLVDDLFYIFYEVVRGYLLPQLFFRQTLDTRDFPF